MAKDTKLEGIYPFFIVEDLAASIEFYNQKLGFETDLIIRVNPRFRQLLKHATSLCSPRYEPITAEC